MDYKMILQKDFFLKSAQVASWIETNLGKYRFLISYNSCKKFVLFYLFTRRKLKIKSTSFSFFTLQTNFSVVFSNDLFANKKA